MTKEQIIVKVWNMGQASIRQGNSPYDDNVVREATLQWALEELELLDGEMIKKPDVLGDEEKLVCSLISKYPFRQVRNVIDEACIHQLDVCVKHYEPLIKEIFEALKGADAVLDLFEQGATIATLRWGVQGTRFITKQVLAKVEAK